MILHASKKCLKDIWTLVNSTKDSTAGVILWASVEQALVIIMGNIPPLRSVTRLQFSSLRSLGSNLLTSWRSRSTSSPNIIHESFTPHKGNPRTFPYEDLEMSSRKSSRDHNTLVDSRMEPAPPSGSFNTNESMAGNEAMGIERKDTYVVSYDRPMKPREAL
ncbi:MAG: hypothetical protein Q9187_007748 [Circinaria calcarea]